MNLKKIKALGVLSILFMLILCIPALAFSEGIESQEITVPNRPVKGVIQLTKLAPVLTGIHELQDAFGNTVHAPLYNIGELEGAVFEVRAVEDIVGKDGTVWYKADELVETITTAADGTASSDLLPLGHYYVMEVSAPEGYVFDATRYDVLLEFKDHETAVVTVNVTAANDFMPTRITLVKHKEVLTTETGKDGITSTTITNVPGEGFVFGLYNSDPITYVDGALEADTLIATAVSDKNGNLAFSGLFPVGDYYVKELSGPDGWELDPTSYVITISDAARTAGNEMVINLDTPILNRLIHADVRVSKTDLTGSDYLPHTLIEIRNENDDIVLRDYTGDDGYLPSFPAIPGTYTYREVLAPEGYELCVTEFSFEVNEDGTVEGMTNVSDDFTRFSIRKEDPFHEPLEGVEFGLFREDGTLQATAISDSNGLVTFEKIPYGTYTIEETKTLSGYLKNITKVPIIIDGTFVNPEQPIATLENCPSEILIQKIDQNGAALQGAEFGLYNESGRLVMTATSDMEGMVRFTYVDYGQYTIRELSAPGGYLLNHDVISVTLDDDYTNSDGPTATVTNHEKKIMCIKVDTSGSPMSSVEFTLYNATTMETVETVTSDADGVLIFRNFDYGDWLIRETAAPEGFCQMEDYTFHVDESWSAPDPVMFVNIPNHYEFVKTDSSGNPLAGVKFQLEDAGGTVLNTYVTGEDGIIRIEGLTPGAYFIREIKTLEGYSLSGEVIKVTLDEFYAIPEVMKQFVNYTTIQTGVRMAITGVMWLGLGLMLVSGTVYIVRKRRNKA